MQFLFLVLLCFSQKLKLCLGVNWALSSGAGSCVVESDCRRLIEAILDPSWAGADLMDSIRCKVKS